MATTQKLSKAAITTLGTIIANGGEMNGFAGQRGFYCNSTNALAKKGLVESLGYCACYNGAECDKNHTTLNGQKGGTSYYNRVRITDAGRVAHADAVAGGSPVPVEKKKTVKKVVPVITVETGTKVARDGLKGKVLEVCTRAGVMLAAVAFGLAEFVWVRVAELVAL